MINKENYLQNIPLELRQYKQWLWFKRIVKVDKWGKEKISKIPISPITLKSDGWNDRKHWTGFETAVNNLKSSGCDGLSFVLSRDDPFVCIDLDRVDDSFGDFLNDFHDTYREVSQSGRGIHIFTKGVIAKNFNNQIEKVEMYKENRCIAMTGNIQRFGSMTVRTIEPKQKELDKYYKLFAPKGSIKEVIMKYHGNVSVRTIKPKQKELDKYYKLFAPKDNIKEVIRKYQMMDDRVPDCNKVIEIMCRNNARAKALFEGSNTSGDPSKDDFVLLLFLNSFTHGNAEMMKEIFLRSALNRIRDKSKRRTEAGYLRYLDESIRKALQGGNQRYWNYNYHRKKGGYSLE